MPSKSDFGNLHESWNTLRSFQATKTFIALTAHSSTMPVTALNHYNLRASREMLDTLRAFYCDVVGLKEGARPPFDSFGYWLYAGEQAILHLSEARPGEHRMSGAVNTFDHAAFSCTGRREVEAHLAHRGVTYEKAVVPMTGQVQLFLQDPAGNGIELNFAGHEA